MDTDSFVINIFTEEFFEDISNDVQRWFDTSNYDKNDKRRLKIGINKKVIRMFKEELGGKTMKEVCAPRAKTYLYLIDCYYDDDYDKNKIINKKAKGTKKRIIKSKIKFDDYYDSVFENKTILRSQLRFKSDLRIVHTGEVNKIAISSNDDKRLQTFNKITTYPHGANAFKVCENEMLALTKIHINTSR